MEAACWLSLKQRFGSKTVAREGGGGCGEYETPGTKGERRTAGSKDQRDWRQGVGVEEPAALIETTI
eukprot:CAMPEP_0194058166 /NCGR_PEP_ID=MMETSP0009_2-20130614/65402_1 /TAXON_ID=210454 /ORGANISM="Grammatophora oceanica, Strain CCMP 410" /LENGTH=66 /DNA_ID=CAMNT_0038708189 /DNA_START=85 /DNA_END=285 /DNA_ORIENTATION=+